MVRDKIVSAGRKEDPRNPVGLNTGDLAQDLEKLGNGPRQHKSPYDNSKDISGTKTMR